MQRVLVWQFFHGGIMTRQVAIGIQQFDKLIEKKCFYVDKTDFICLTFVCFFMIIYTLRLEFL